MKLPMKVFRIIESFNVFKLDLSRLFPLACFGYDGYTHKLRFNAVLPALLVLFSAAAAVLHEVANRRRAARSQTKRLSLSTPRQAAPLPPPKRRQSDGAHGGAHGDTRPLLRAAGLAALKWALFITFAIFPGVCSLAFQVARRRQPTSLRNLSAPSQTRTLRAPLRLPSHPLHPCLRLPGLPVRVLRRRGRELPAR